MSHTFQPWRIESGKCVMLSDEWKKIRNINARQDGKTFSMEHPVKPPIVQVTADPFAEFEGEIVDENGKGLVVDVESGRYRWFTGTGDTDRHADKGDLLDDLFTLITDCPNLNFWMATEHLERVREVWPKMDNQGHHWKHKNVTLFATVHNQQEADERTSKLLELRHLVGGIGVKYVPVGAVDFSRTSKTGFDPLRGHGWLDGIDRLWIASPSKRPVWLKTWQKEWIADAANQATAAGVEVFNEFERGV